MQCRCGAATKGRSSVVNKLEAELSYQECDPCGRVHIEHLKVRGQIVARGRQASEIFNGDLERFLSTPQQAGFAF
ncbi:hypothetical protein VNPA120661_46350 [Pseudomonas aeruginosa]|uniref:Uncharacterized protein n=1 Tax=Pseudomonas putida S12 TaxID=1215087 RepID=A0AA34S0H5_PSEPU|nr:hypothetical protein [Pseudomonas putida]AJA16805.1 hypothetical protein RPPX_25945 [Pseudomonas putida S12]AVX92760.1 hypothetical protein PkP19E3_31945 [Pseudomonas koreensis]EQL44008.1 hypothetical protein M770_30015 [Pseudomonas aeruginosa VRFPA03]ERV73082.1 hypothetical protein Q041_06324 [Pseudomonas aeruginosa BWHPSA028]KSR47774.1 hypothetical protein APB53_04895 [Pseudomonas aeruginosa]